ncbi:hypothetical protein LTR94_029506, partial [Friedmanniomyces endolithicus]
MARVHANGIEIEYEETGPKDGPAMLLVMGLGAQLVRWPLSMVEALAERGVVLGEDYPAPVVDHDAARRRTLERFAVVRKS